MDRVLEENFDWKSAMADLERKLRERDEKLRPARVLVVDDDKQDVYLTLRLLEAFDCVPFSCSSSQEAIDLLASEKFDLVLMDMKLPGFDGVQIIEKVMQKTSKMARIVIVSGIPVNPIVDKSLQLGAVWAKKPLTSQVLKTFLRAK